MPRLLAQVGRFGVVGVVGLVVDVVLFNVLRATVLAPEEVEAGPIIAKIVSTSVAIVANWIGSRYWAFRLEHRRPPLREAVEFVLVSIGGLLIAVGCLAISRELLGFTSLLADNIASNVVGLGLGSLFRFALYRWWVFHPRRGRRPHDETAGGHPVRSDPALGT
ncbi:GtrA family protein [Microcella daejeonensis]|uniref:GtrA family protein n=1 Tax=Microcella daejeonensis TaxID=2994971 RepID=A0A9E8S9D5_9MICO|nr:GtrA family protein [Microcella daejeonensis]WAB81889.1 GtrA family protein [Microcella daejeonensis]WAB84054.1 GtrA family protein [Microcella daejeonensis]